MNCSVCLYPFEAQYRFCRVCGNDSQNPLDSSAPGVDHLSRAYQITRGGEAADYRRALPHFAEAAKYIDSLPHVVAVQTLNQYALSTFRIVGGSFPEDLAQLSLAEVKDLVSALEKLVHRYSALPEEGRKAVDIGGADSIRSDLFKAKEELQRRELAPTHQPVTPTPIQSGVLQASALLEGPTEELRNFQLGYGEGTVNLYSAFIKDFPTEHHDAEERGRTSQFFQDRIGHYLEQCQRVESKLRDVATPNEVLGKLRFTQGRLYSVIGRWAEAKRCFEEALVNGMPKDGLVSPERKIRYYLAFTYNFESSEAELAIEQLKRVIELSGPGRMAEECARQINAISLLSSKGSKTPICGLLVGGILALAASLLTLGVHFLLSRS